MTSVYYRNIIDGKIYVFENAKGFQGAEWEESTKDQYDAQQAGMEQESSPELKAALLAHFGLRRGLENIITRLHVSPETETYFGLKKLDDWHLLEVLDNYIKELRANQK